MEVVNPTDRTPTDPENEPRASCHCVCYDGHDGAYALAWIPGVKNCKCNCADPDVNPYNKQANYDLAEAAAES